MTDAAVRNAKPGAKSIRLFDERGLYLEIAPSGGKWWRFKYRYGGKEKRLSLGVYPDVGLRDARERRDGARKLLANGADPGEVRKAQRASRTQSAANSFEIVAREWHAKQSPSWSDSYKERVLWRLERYVFPYLGARPIAEVTAPDLLAVARRIEDRSTRYRP